uniref:Uncharacterized protein n=1 Tax=Megaselia scalaris TaxID=36166 RepID=T1GVL2_MEGSC
MSHRESDTKAPIPAQTKFSVLAGKLINSTLDSEAKKKKSRDRLFLQTQFTRKLHKWSITHDKSIISERILVNNICGGLIDFGDSLSLPRVCPNLNTISRFYKQNNQLKNTVACSDSWHSLELHARKTTAWPEKEKQQVLILKAV